MMPGIDLHMLAAANDAVLSGANAPVTGVCIDSRLVGNGDLFVALKGEHVDGHNFVGSAAERGAVAAVVETVQDIALPQIIVADTQRALGVIAKVNRDAYRGKVAAITGSAGKTTCKNMLAAILSQAGNVCATQGNLNNELGLPLTVQRLEESHDYAVLEMGAAKAGDIDYLVQIGQPHVSAVTNISEAHIGGFGSLETTAQTKGEIYGALTDGGFAVINADDDFANGWYNQIERRDVAVQIIRCCLQNNDADIYASAIQQLPNGQSFIANVQGAIAAEDSKSMAALPITLKLPGVHNISNALIAIAIARALDVSDQAIIDGLAGVEAEAGRLSLRSGRNNLAILDDSYNANPKAVEAAIDTFLRLPATEAANKTIAVLGDMAELGEQAAQLHYQMGQYAASRGIDQLCAIGEFAGSTLDGFTAEAASGVATEFESQQPLAEYLLDDDCMGAAVLVKGSRSAAMEQLVAKLVAGESIADTNSTDSKNASNQQEKNSLC